MQGCYHGAWYAIHTGIGPGILPRGHMGGHGSVQGGQGVLQGGQEGHQDHQQQDGHVQDGQDDYL